MTRHDSKQLDTHATPEKQRDDAKIPANEPTVINRHVAQNAVAPGHDLPQSPPAENGGQAGPEPTRYGDWEKKGRCTDF